MGKRKGKSQSEIEELESLKSELRRARSKGLFKEIADLLNRLGTTNRELKQYEDALENHDEEIEITKKYFPNDKIGLAIAYRAKAEVYIEMKEEEEALPLVREYLKLSKSAADLVEEQRAHVTLGRVYLGLAIKYSELDESSSQQESKTKALNKAENEFQRARDLSNSSEMEDKKLGPGLMDMRCGVLLNIAIVLEMKGNVEGSKQFIMRAIEIAKDHKFYDLFYRSQINLCEIYVKLENFKDARNAAEEAAKAGKSLDNFNMEIDGRILEAKMYFLLDEITGGVRALKKLRKNILIKKRDEVMDSLEEIEDLLKAGVKITRTEDKLHVTDKIDYKARQKLYECLGDSYIDIGNYTEAIIHYRNSIQNAEKANVSDKILAKLYFSVAVTYKDKGDDMNALHYFQKEIELHSNNPSEAFKTQTNITGTLEKMSNVSKEQIMSAHEKAIELATICDCPRKKITAFNNFANYLKIIKRNIQASEMKNKADDIIKLYDLSEENEEPDSQEDLLDEDSSNSIDLDNLTSDEDNMSDEDENDSKNKVPPKKRKFRVNEKGETALHRAAIKGDIKILRRLIREGHDVNAKDSGGWVPLHEACNFGHLDIVEELLKKGANVNAVCGKVCNELTPLHDAANNGHCDVILILLNYKANVLVRDTKGNYPIDLLIAWRERAKADGTIFTPEDLIMYREIRTTLKDLMQKAGKSYERSDEIRARKYGKQDNDEKNNLNIKLMESKIHGMGPIPVRITVEDYDPDDGNAAVDLYSTTIRDLRRKNKQSSRRGRDVSSDEETGTGTIRSGPLVQDGLIPASQYVDDDWLVDGDDDDLQKIKTTKQQQQTKRKRDPMDEIRIMDSRNIRRRREGQRNDIARLDIGQQDDENSEELLDLDIEDFDVQEKSVTVSEVEQNSNNSEVDSEIWSAGQEQNEKRIPTFSELHDDDDDDSDEGDEDLLQDNMNIPKKSTNAIILSSDDDDESADDFQDPSHYRRLNNNIDVFPSSPSTSSSSANKVSKLSRNRSRVLQTRLPFKVVQNTSSAENNKNTNNNNKTIKSPPSDQTLNWTENILRLKVRVNEKVFIVPVVESHFNDTIEWLCEECSKRYFDSYGVKPILTLSTKDGAILSGNDIIRVVLYGNETELIATVISFDLQRLPERFNTAGSKIPNFKYDDEILQGLEICQSSNVLNISECNLRNKIGHTLFQALQYQNTLRELYLPDCSLHDEGVHHLAAIMSTLPNLITLDLSCNGITSNGIHDLSESFKNTLDNFQNQQRQLSSLTTLNLSYNPLGNSSGSPLTNLLSQLTQLKNLFLANCDFTVRLLTESRLSTSLNKLKLEQIDMSYNKLGKTGMDTILQSLTPGRIKNLNCTSNCVENEENNFSTVLCTFLSRNEDCCNLKELNLSDCDLNDSCINEIACHIGRLVRLESLILCNNEEITLCSVETILNECTSNKIPLIHLDFGSCPKLWKIIGFPIQRLLDALEKKLESEKKLEFFRLTIDDDDDEHITNLNINDDDDDTTEIILSSREKKIAKLWEDYSGIVPFTCIRNGNFITFTYEK